MGSVVVACDDVAVEEFEWLRCFKVTSGKSADKGGAAGVRGNNAILGRGRVLEKVTQECVFGAV
jgi:hypothetical protein